jgi:hypothetical protein
MGANFRPLSTEKLVETAEKLYGRVMGRFPDAGLARVASTLVDICRDAVQKAEEIQRPIWWLRISLVVLTVAVFAAVVLFTFTLNHPPLEQVVQIVQWAGGALAYLGAGAWFLFTLETTIKRYRAIEAIHELRALAHIIDMHQLAKTPDGDIAAGGVILDDMKMRRYLQYCTELLAILSKIGQLYVQNFPDGTTLAAVDQFESLATNLSQKIWQKIMVFDVEGKGTPAA